MYLRLSSLCSISLSIFIYLLFALSPFLSSSIFSLFYLPIYLHLSSLCPYLICLLSIHIYLLFLNFLSPVLLFSTFYLFFFSFSVCSLFLHMYIHPLASFSLQNFTPFFHSLPFSSFSFFHSFSTVHFFCFFNSPFQLVSLHVHAVVSEFCRSCLSRSVFLRIAVFVDVILAGSQLSGFSKMSLSWASALGAFQMKRVSENIVESWQCNFTQRKVIENDLYLNS
jgi:hypothetical protein